MDCPKCQQENRPGANFCSGCRETLEIVCPQCSRGNPAQSRFCDNCGQPLAEAFALTPEAKLVSCDSYTPKHLAEKILTSKSGLEGERKQVTLLSGDLRGQD